MKTYTKQKKNLVGLYLSEEEHQWICRTAAAYGMTKSETVRRLCFRENENNTFRRNDGWNVKSQR